MREEVQISVVKIKIRSSNKKARRTSRSAVHRISDRREGSLPWAAFRFRAADLNVFFKDSAADERGQTAANILDTFRFLLARFQVSLQVIFTGSLVPATTRIPA